VILLAETAKMSCRVSEQSSLSRLLSALTADAALRHEIGVKYLMRYSIKEHNEENLSFVLEADRYARETDEMERRRMLPRIFNTFIASAASLQVNCVGANAAALRSLVTGVDESNSSSDQPLVRRRSIAVGASDPSLLSTSPSSSSPPNEDSSSPSSASEESSSAAPVLASTISSSLIGNAPVTVTLAHSAPPHALYRLQIEAFNSMRNDTYRRFVQVASFSELLDALLIDWFRPENHDASSGKFICLLFLLSYSVTFE
jgi:hypothetical protein